MEIYSKNGDCNKAKTGVYLEHQDSSGKKRYKAPLPPITELPSSTLPAKKGLTKWSSTPVIHQDFSELTFPLARKVPDVGKLGRKTFLRSTEHILATFYGLVFIIEGAEWHSLKSDCLPIYFIRVSVKNVKYPFRILVIDSEGQNQTRLVDFIVNCKTKTSVKEDAVCWQDQQTFGAKFSNTSQAFQFYDTISRMASTLRKGNELENQNLDKMVVLEIYLPNSQVRTYRFLKTDTLKDALKRVCNKERFSAYEYYFHHMQRTDDSLDMTLRVGDLRTDKIRLISKREVRGSSNDTLDKVSISSSKKKQRGMFSMFRRKFSRKRKDSRQYSSQPSVIQYTDNVFMVDRNSDNQKNDEIQGRSGNSSAISGTHSLARATKSDTTDSRATSRTLPTRTVKRKAPLPPNLIMQKSEPPTAVVNGQHTIDGKKTTKKRRAPSPPRDVTSPVNDETSSNQGSLQSETKHEVTTDKTEQQKSLFPVFVAPPPPESTPPPIDECETPVGPIDLVFVAPPPPESTPPPIDECETPVGPIDLDDGSVEIPVEINGVIGDTKSLDSKSSENREDETKDIEEADKEVEVKVELDLKDGQNSKTDVSDTVDKNEQDEKVVEDQAEADEDKIDGDTLLKADETSTPDSKAENKPEKVDENKNSVNQGNLKNMTPEQIQALLKTQNPQDPLNLQNQQLFAMQQNQQMLSNILLQQMLQQQMAQPRQPTIMPMPMSVSPSHPMQLNGGVNGGMMSPVGTMPGMQPQLNGGNYSMWPQTQPPVPPQPPTPPQPVPPSEPKPTDEVKISTTTTSPDNLPNQLKSESGSQTETPKPPPVKEEELVNRPLFKKMLAQVSQGKLQGIPPKIASQKSQEAEATPTSPISPTAKITKVPTSYVASAEKNVPQSKPEEERSAPISLGEVERKSSYVDSAIGKKNVESVVQNDVKVVTEIPENNSGSVGTITPEAVDVDSTIDKQSKASEPTVKNEKTSEQEVVTVAGENISFSTSTSVGNSIKHDNTTSSAILTQNAPSVPKVLNENKPQNQVQTVDTPNLTAPIKPSVTRVNHSPNDSRDPVNHISPSGGITVVNQNPVTQSKLPEIAPKPQSSSPGVALVNHNHPPNINSVAQQAAQAANEKRNSQISKPPSYVGHTPHKLKIEEQVLGTLKYQRTIVPPLSPPSYASKTSTELNQNGGEVPYKYATTSRVNTGSAKPPVAPRKPRHLSQPTDTAATKPTYDIRQTKTLPTKSKKPQHIKISLSLTPEERMQLHNKPPGIATNTAGR